MIKSITDTHQPYDVVVIGGGATGLGIAVDAASRGYSTLLLERDDFAKGTSSRSTKLAHGGVRYLAQGNVRLVMEALRERGIMKQNAPALIRDLPFIVPAYRWWEIPFYLIGLKLYDLLAGRAGIAPSRWLSREETLLDTGGGIKRALGLAPPAAYSRWWAAENGISIPSRTVSCWSSGISTGLLAA